MTEREKSLGGSRVFKMNGSYLGSSLNKSQVQGHVKSIMPSLRGGKKQDQIKYLRIRVQNTLNAQKNLQNNLKPHLQQICGEYYDYKTFRDKAEILKQEIAQQDLYYIFMKDEIADWGQKFSKEELKQSDGKKNIQIVQFLRRNKYNQKQEERRKLIQKKRRDPHQKYIHFINSDEDYMQQMRSYLIPDMNQKLRNKLLREGDKIKTWANANKFKQKKQKKQRLYIYIENMLMDKLSTLYRRFKNRNGFKWTEIVGFSSFKDILENVKKRQEQYNIDGALLQSNAPSFFASKIMDKSLSRINTHSFIAGGPSMLSGNKSVKNIIHEKTQHKLRNDDKNIIIHSSDFEQADKIYQYVMDVKGNWRRIVYEDKNIPYMNQLVKQIDQNQRQTDQDQYLKIIKAPNLNIMTFQDDEQTAQVVEQLPNILNNREVIGYENSNQLAMLLNNYAKNDNNFTIVIIESEDSPEDEVYKLFRKNNPDIDNVLVKYKNKIHRSQPYESHSQLSFVSKGTIEGEQSIKQYLRAVFEDRDRDRDPFNCFGNNYVYILYRSNKQNLIDQDVRRKIAQSARLKKSPYQDGNYLEQFLKGLERSGDHAFIVTDDQYLREAQQVAKKFQNVQIMNITDRKSDDKQIKVLVWGSPEVIKQHIFKIGEKDVVEQRKQYKNLQRQIWRQNPFPRRLPKNIEFKQGNNITVKISENQTHPESDVMEQNLKHYFKEQIRIQNYLKPNQIRLVNKIEQPLTFIICRDKPDELQYMKSIAKQERDDLRQQYILYTQNPQPYINSLFSNEKYERFRFISNSWKKIQEYIIGLYQNIRGLKNEVNDSIYQDEYIHVFYHPEDVHLVNYFNQNHQNTKIWHRIKFHPINQLQWTALEESPHHLYYVLVDETNGRFMTNQAVQEIQRVERVLQARNVARKNMKMIVVTKKTGVMRDRYTQGTFQNGQQAMNYIAYTTLLMPRLEINRPHIIIDKTSPEWYYFLNKYLYRDRYLFYFVSGIPEAMKLIQNIRSTQYGSQFWYLTSNRESLFRFLQVSNNYQNGNRIYGVFHGSLNPNQFSHKIIMSSPERQEIQAFLLNTHKRSQTIFSPESLRKKPPIIAVSNISKDRIPLSQLELKKWKEDLNADYIYFNNIGELKSLNPDRNIFLVVDAEEDRALKNLKEGLPNNIWRIVFDSNEKERKKAHNLYTIYPNAHQVYYGYYPAQISHYLRYLRYNIKNPAEKLKQMYGKQLINVYIQQQLSLTNPEVENILRNNHSISNIFSFERNPSSIQNAINHSMSMPNYGNLFIFDKQSVPILNSIPTRNSINYIIYDDAFRVNRIQGSNQGLLTDQRPEYVTYLNNLPQNRYSPALNFRSKNPLKLMYLNNGQFDKEVEQLRKINQWNSNFTIAPYQNISELASLKENVVVLTDAAGYDRHIRELNLNTFIRYFVLGNDKTRNLYPVDSNSEFFITKQINQLSGFFQNLRKGNQLQSPIPFPTISVPAILDNKQINFSRNLSFLNRLNLKQINIQNYLKKVAPPAPIIQVPSFNPHNFIDQPNQQILLFPHNLVSDKSMEIVQNFNNYRYLLSKNVQPLTLCLDIPPFINQSMFNSRPDQTGLDVRTLKLKKPVPKTVQRKLAIVHPDNKQFRQIFRVLQCNLTPKSFTKVESFPYQHDYDFENLARNESKFLGFDRTVIFLTPRMAKYQNQLRQINRKMNGKTEYYYFNDNFNNYYDGFRQFLSPYIIKQQEIPYVNKEDPKLWLRINSYNVLVQLNKKKRYDKIQRQNIYVTPYLNQQDIQNQLHQMDKFVIIVCDKKDFHRFKKFPRMSPRCIIVVQDTQPINEDQIPLNRYPRKVLYYGPDALNYLSKTRIPMKSLPFRDEPMKVLFYNQNDAQQVDYAYLDDFQDYQKVSYLNSEDLFIKLIQKFKNSSNFKVPPPKILATGARDLIKLHPKIYIQRKASYMNKYLSEYESIHQLQFKRTFESIIKPEQYSHLPTKEYDNPQDLRQCLESQQSPCLVYLDQNARENMGIERDYKKKHLFIYMFDLLDMWIYRDGRLVQPHKLKRPLELAVKQTLFTSMFNKDVFDEYNDMGYFYLSNTATVDKVRRITFMTKQALSQKFKKQPNLLMIVFVQWTDLRHIPEQFYDQVGGYTKQDRVKLIFIHKIFVHNENVLYVKFNEIDPVIIHINNVQMASRQDFCVYPSNNAGQIKWHKFIQKHKGFKPIEYADISQMDAIAQQIKGKFRQVYVICQPDEENFIRNAFGMYSIKTKQKTGEKLKFWHLTQADNISYIGQFSKIKASNINFQEGSQDFGYQTAGNPVYIQTRSKNSGSTNRQSRNLLTVGDRSPNASSPKHNGYNSLSPSYNRHESNSRSVQKTGNSSKNLQKVIESKNFVVYLNQNLRQLFPLGNLYAQGVNYFSNLQKMKKDSRQFDRNMNHVVVTNQNLNYIKSEIESNPNLYLVYVSNSVPPMKEGNLVVINEAQIPKFLKNLQGMQKSYPSTNYESNPNYQSLNSNYQNDLKDPKLLGSVSPQSPRIKQKLHQFKVVKLFYDEGLNRQTKKQIYLAALKNKNFRPYLFKDFNTLKQLIKEEGSISLLLISKDLPNLKEQLQKQNFTVINNKKGRVIVPKFANSTIEGLSTILQEDESQLDKEATPEDVQTYLKMLQKNPERGRQLILGKNYESDKNQNKQQGNFLNKLGERDDLDSDKLNVHSNINIQGKEDLNNILNIKQRLDGGVIVLFVGKNMDYKKLNISEKYAILIQEYGHAINLNNSLREKKDKFTLVLVQPNMLSQVRNLKQQHPKTVFVLLNKQKREISTRDRKNIQIQISDYEEFEPIIYQLLAQNQRLKYGQGKPQSKMQNKKTSYVDNGNSWRLTNGYQNTRFKNAFVFYHQQINKNLLKKVQNLSHITFIPYKDFDDAQKKCNSYNGYQMILIANGQDVKNFEDYVQKKKQQAYLIKLNQPEDHRQNPKIKKNILSIAISQDQVANFLIQRFGEYIPVDRNQQRPKEGKSYAPRYQPNTFGTTPRFPSEKDYVPLKNDPIYSSRGMKSLSRDSKLKSQANSNRQINPRNAQSPNPYYAR